VEGVRFRLSRRRFLATSGAATLALASPPLADTRAETAGTRTTPDKLPASLESLDG
jgi:hypothetical protein